MTSDLQFQIDQLRKDKMIFALESIVINTFVVAFIFTIGLLIPSGLWTQQAQYLVGGICAIVAISYTLYALIGNFFRWQKIKTLEKQLGRNR